MIKSCYLFDKHTRAHFRIKKAIRYIIEKEVQGVKKTYKFYYYSFRDNIISLLEFEYFRNQIITGGTSKKHKIYKSIQIYFNLTFF